MRLAETMSMAVFLNLNNSSQDSRQEPRRRKSNLKDVNQLETLDEASRGEKVGCNQLLLTSSVSEVSDESSRNTPMSSSQEPVSQVAVLASLSDGEEQ